MKRAVTACALASISVFWVVAQAVAGDAPDTRIPADSIAHNFAPDPYRLSLAERGLTYSLNYTGEYYNVMSGGVSRGSALDGFVDGAIDVDLERNIGWSGGTLHGHAFYFHGEGPTTKHIGDIFTVSNLEALATWRVNELWFEQALLDDKLRIKLGALAADTEFFTSDTAGAFLNGTFGWAGIFATNMVQGGPAYPLTSMGARLQFSPTANATLLAGIFNGSPASPVADDPQRVNRHGTRFRFGDGALIMLEGQYTYDAVLPGVVKVGGWRQFNDDVYSDFLTGAPVNGSHGLYAIVDQQVWKGSGDQSLNVFGRVSSSPEKQNLIDFYFDTGILFAGFVPGRPTDAFGVAFGYGEISEQFVRSEIAAGQAITSAYEAVLEVNYEAQVMPGVTIVPDFQYIWNPGGRVENPNKPGTAVGDAAVVGVRMRVTY